MAADRTPAITPSDTDREALEALGDWVVRVMRTAYQRRQGEAPVRTGGGRTPSHGGVRPRHSAPKEEGGANTRRPQTTKTILQRPRR